MANHPTKVREYLTITKDWEQLAAWDAERLNDE